MLRTHVNQEAGIVKVHIQGSFLPAIKNRLSGRRDDQIVRAATHQLLAQYGWTNIATAEIYTKGINRKKLGIEASRIVADQIENITTPHQNSGEGISSNNKRKPKT